jgi:hypothetical protein
MRDPNRLREQARRCCTLAKIVIDPELVEQLRMCFIELTDEADTAEGAPSRGNGPSCPSSPTEPSFND